MTVAFPLPPSFRPPEISSVTDWDTRVSVEAPRVPWDVFTSRIFHWSQGEHVGIIGPTGQGKTTLLMHILPLQPYVVVFASKPRDVTMMYLINTGYLKIERWQSSLSVRTYPRRVLWPDASKLNSKTTQREIFLDAMDKIYREKGWCVAIDEGWYFTKELGLDSAVKTYLLQARSLGISLVFATQRPAWVPLEVYDQSTHLFFYRDNDERNLRRLAGISWRSADLIRHVVSNLDTFQCLYINTRTGQMYRTRAPLPFDPDEGRGEN